MPEGKRILILGGTAEASDLAERVETLWPDRAVLSLAGAAATRREHACAVRIGGFGGAEGMARYLTEEGIGFVVDATHPFAPRISANARAACEATKTPRLMLVRPPWEPGPGDDWTEVADETEAVRALDGRAERVLLTLGRRRLAPFATVQGVHFVVRAIEPFDAPLPGATIVVAPPPYHLEDERALMREQSVDTLITRNSGGGSGQAKLQAARELGIRVVLIAQPPPESGETGDRPAAAVEWLKGRS